MTDDQNHTILVRKILVAVDTSAHSRAALEAAASLAKITEANIHGIFVQETHWRKVGRLPSVKAVNELTGKSHSLEKDTLEKQIEQLKKRLHRQLKFISQRSEISHSWETTSGPVADKILEAAKEADLITIGRSGRSFFRHKRLGSTAKAIIQQADKPVLVLKKGLRLGITITCIYDATEESQRGLRLALSLAEKNDTKLSILVMNNSEETSGKHQTSIGEMVDNAHIPISVSTMRRAGIGQFIHTVNRQQSGLLIISRSQPYLQNDLLETTLKYLNCPILITP
ncbi:MAG: universal stress protein [Balneolaceae bacterium]|nr:universal stress protein [Balneolaceae bacterium]